MVLGIFYTECTKDYLKYTQDLIPKHFAVTIRNNALHKFSTGFMFINAETEAK